jgi:hypothetical protein
LKRANLFKSKATKNTGATIDITKKIYEKKRATFLTLVELFLSIIFITEKNVKSKYISIKNLIYTLNLNYDSLDYMNVPNLALFLQHLDKANRVKLISTTTIKSIKIFIRD